MVRSSGHHRKRSRSRSITPDHKRSKSSRDYDKDRPRRRSRSRDRLRRSRSRDRKKDKKIPESRVRSKPLKLKRRSRSGSRSKSKEKVTKKEDKKEIKEDEPFDPTNLDKVPGEDEEWVVTDILEETGVEDNGDLEEEYDYEADEDDRYSRRSSSSHRSHPSSSQDAPNQLSEEISEIKEDNDKNVTSTNSEIGKDKNDLVVTDEIKKDEELNEKTLSPEKESLKDVVSKLKDISSKHKTNTKLLSGKYEVDRHKRNDSYRRSYSNFKCPQDIERLLKDQIRQSMKFEKELHNLRVKNETARHKAELELVKIQLDYWKGKA